ncbi:hypothetical protein [Methylobacterium sp. E-066]|uniref:hypothetical protein n=1 Tax=Methylobacterium sp. E-066 TaxID=2836584 RepID=UPI001FBBBFA1|nr:hypothetical protein [Methylobacterium sp. E-066]MCJ2139485.1 hypothetical protein [Methylobacterium sp. E-066]
MQADLSRVVRKPQPAPPPMPEPTDWNSPPPGFMAYPEREPMSFLNIPEGLRLELERLRNIAEIEFERVTEMAGGGLHETMRAGMEDRLRRRLRLNGIEAALAPELPVSAGIEDRAGLVYYEDAAGKTHCRPVADWIGFTAQRLYTVACQEMSRQFNAQCGGLDEAGNRALDAKLRRELRIDALFALTFHSHKVFEAADLRRYGTEEEIAAAVPEIEADPVHAVIEAVRRCLLDCTVAQQLPQPPGRLDPLPEQEAAGEALHASLDALAVTVPTTAEGCASLARFAVEFHAAEGFAADEDEHGQQHLGILNLIARSPMGQRGAALGDKAALKWSQAQADAVDLSDCSITALARLFELFTAAADTWSNLSCLPYVEDNTATSRIVDGEYERAAFVRDRILGLLRNRRPSNNSERDDALSVRLRYEMDCEMKVRDQALLAEINAAWGA